MPAIKFWFWEIRDERTGRRRRLRYRMTEQDARERLGTEVSKIEWSLEIRDGDPTANSTSSFQRKNRCIA